MSDPSRKSKRNHLWVMLMSAILVLFLLFVYILPIITFNTDYYLSTEHRCTTQLRRLFIAFSAYSMDYDGYLPRASYWMDQAQSYTLDNGYHCPAVSGENNYGYAMNVQLSGKSLHRFSDQTMPMLYDSANLARNATDFFTSLPNPPRHRVNVVCYADGSVKKLRP
jgi:hypothetical protein